MAEARPHHIRVRQQQELVLVESGRVVVCLKGDDMSLVVPNTVKETFTPGDGSTARLSVGSKCMLLTVGRMDSRQRYKGQDRVISAILYIVYIVAQGYDLEYVIVGEGDGRARLEALL